MASKKMEEVGMRIFLAIGLTLISAASFAADEGNAERGRRVFGACAACHSLQPDKNLSGPSLADLWDRQAGGLKSFSRYSDALKSSGIIWDNTSLDAWLANPRAFIPDNDMTFRGISDAGARADLLAFLKEATKPGYAQTAQTQGGGLGGMMGGAAPDLKKLDPEDRVQAITYCRDTYRVTTADGKTRAFWERNLRFKTDSSDEGPAKGAPAIVGAGMMGDRASVVFSAPEEWAQLVVRKC
jgi:cytochrome c